MRPSYKETSLSSSYFSPHKATSSSSSFSSYNATSSSSSSLSSYNATSLSSSSFSCHKARKMYDTPIPSSYLAIHNARKHNKMAKFDMKRQDTPVPMACSVEKWCYSYNSFGIEGRKILEAFFDRHYLDISILSPYQHLVFDTDNILPSYSTELFALLIDEIVSDGRHSDCIVIIDPAIQPCHNILIGSTVAWKNLYDPYEARDHNDEEWQVSFESYFSGGVMTYDLSYVRGMIRLPLESL